MSRTLALRTLALADLGEIAGIAEVSSTPKPAEEIATPGIAITSGKGGVSEPETLTNRNGSARHEFRLELVVNEADADDAMDDLLDLVRNVIERSTGHLMTDPLVEMATVTEWDEARTEQGIHKNVVVRGATVEVRYLYVRGAL